MIIEILNIKEEIKKIKSQEPRVQEPRVQEPRVQEPRVQEPRVQEPRVQEPRVQDNKLKNLEYFINHINKSKKVKNIFDKELKRRLNKK
jgi:preprotein translocase subunit SecD